MYCAGSYGFNAKQILRCNPCLNGVFSLMQEASCKRVKSHYDKCHIGEVCCALRGLFCPGSSANKKWISTHILIPIDY